MIPAESTEALSHDPSVGFGAVLLLAAVGVVVGVLNTIAGGGAFLALPLLIGLGVPPGVANGTIRLGVLLQNVSSVVTFWRRGYRDLGVVLRLSPPVVIGAVLGAWAVTRLPDTSLQPLIGGVLLAWAVFLLLRPDRFLSPPATVRPVGPLLLLLAFAVGAYGGFLQAGVGFPLIALLVGGMGYDPVRGNSLKVALVLAYTIVSFPVFVWHDKVAWHAGSALAAGMLFGGWAGTRLQLRAGARLVHGLVIVMVIVSGLTMLLRD